MPGRLSPAAPEGTPRPTDRLPWADVLASISDGVIVLDADGILYDLNPAAEQLTGVAASQGVGLRLEQLVEARPTNAWLAELAQATLREGLKSPGADPRLAAMLAKLLRSQGQAAEASAVLESYARANPFGRRPSA